MSNAGVRVLFGVLTWGGIIVLQFMLLVIARFFEQTSGQHTGYRLYLLPIVLTGIGATRYLLRIPAVSPWPDFVGDPMANILLFAAGLMLMALGNFLHEKMMGGAAR